MNDSEEISMKKLLSLALTLLLVLALTVSFAGCGKTDAPATDGSGVAADSEAAAPAGAELVGEWAYDSNYIYTFNADGTGQYDAGGTIMPLTYEIPEDGQLSILFEGNTDPMVTEYKVEGDVLTILDSLNNEVVYKKK